MRNARNAATSPPESCLSVFASSPCFPRPDPPEPLTQSDSLVGHRTYSVTFRVTRTTNSASSSVGAILGQEEGRGGREGGQWSGGGSVKLQREFEIIIGLTRKEATRFQQLLRERMPAPAPGVGGLRLCGFGMCVSLREGGREGGREREGGGGGVAE